MIKCPKCKTELEDGALFCDKCGTSIIEGKKNQRRNIFILSTIIAVVICICVSIIFVNLTKTREFIFYLKNDELYAAEVDSLKPMQITTNLKSIAYTQDYSYDFANLVANGLKINEENKTLFYIDENHDLYSKKLNNLNGKGKLIANNVYSYVVSRDGNTVLYRNSKDELYLKDASEDVYITNNVYRFQLSTDGKKFYYLSNSDLYYANKGEEPIKINSLEEDEYQIGYVSDDLSEMYLLENKILSKYTDGKKVEDIATDVAFITESFEDGSFYYAQYKSSDKTYLADFVEDDMLESDQNLVKPTKPVSPSRSDYDSYSDYKEARNKYYDLYDEYKEALELYENKSDRDKLRENLKSTEYSCDIYNLQYYDGEKSTQISDKLYSSIDVSPYSISQESAKIIFATLDINDIEKIKLSELLDEYYYDIVIQSHLANYVKLYASKKTTTMNLGDVSAEYYWSRLNIDSKDDLIYYSVLDEYEDTSDLYYAKIEDGVTASFQLYDSDIVNYYLLAGGNVVTTKNDTSSDGKNFYLNGEYVDYQGIVMDYYYFSEIKNTLYSSHINASGNLLLQSYSKGKNELISSDVTTFYMTSEDDIYYISPNEEGGNDLYLYRNGKHKLIDKDINRLIIPQDSYYECISN